jgi:hypothetical protein
MEEGFDIHIDRPIDPVVADNAKILSQIWEMWVPESYHSINVYGKGEWRRAPRTRLPRVDLFSGGIDSTFCLLANRDAARSGFAATICGFDKIRARNFTQLIAKTDPIVKGLNCERISIENNVKHKRFSLTHGLTLASSLFFLSDLFEQGTIAADQTHAQDFNVWPWGSNHLTNERFVGSDFIVRSVGAEKTRTEKVAVIAKSGIDLQSLSFCREPDVVPSNCGLCDKCITIKAMFLVTTGTIPSICVDNSFYERSLRRLLTYGSGRIDVFDMYFYAKNNGFLERLKSLPALIEECRARTKAR